MELSEAIERCRVNDIFLCEGPRQPQKGSLVLTGHHLIFSPEPLLKDSKSSVNAAPATCKLYEQELWLLHRAVDRVIVEPIGKSSTQRPKQGAYLRLRCKNFMTCCIRIEDYEDCAAVARSVEKLSNLNGFEHDYPFYYRVPFRVLDDGWLAFSVEEQFARLLIQCPDRWRISYVNRNFEACASYPEAVIVPKGIGDDYLRISATFRDGGRFPVFSYYHIETKSYIVRCSQPLIGPTSRRCKEDETILNSLLSSTAKGIIYDTRSKATAVAAKGRAAGVKRRCTIVDGSTSTETFRECAIFTIRWLGWLIVLGCREIFMPEEQQASSAITPATTNATVPTLCPSNSGQFSMASVSPATSNPTTISSSIFSYGSLYSSLSSYAAGAVASAAANASGAVGFAAAAAAASGSDRWLSRLIASGWLQHVADVLTGAATVAQCVHCEEISIVVHGADGVDSTLLITSLAQICLDPDTRTLRGFEALIEREWLAAGHPFSMRCAHFAYASGALTGPHEAPIFLCFLDCLWQMMRQYPCSFEFGEEFLIFLFEHAYASEFGSFLGANEAEKRRHNVKNRTVSLWSYVNHPDVLATFVSAQYEPYPHAIWPSVAPQSIVLWERLYLRWQQSWSDFDETKRQLTEWKRYERELQTQLNGKFFIQEND